MVDNYKVVSIVTVHAEVEGTNRICISFRYDAGLVAAVKQISGAKFRPGSKTWGCQLTLDHCYEIRKTFGSDLTIGPKLKSWATEETRSRKQLISMATATDATLVNLPSVATDLANTLRPDQRVGVRFIAESKGVLIADEPGLGKTLEAIGGLLEAKALTGPTLVIAPISAVDNAWEKELLRWQEYPVFTCLGNRDQKEETLADFAHHFVSDENAPCWVVVNLAMIQMQKSETGKSILNTKGKCRCGTPLQNHDHYTPRFPILHMIDWQNIIIDECHKGALRDLRKVTGISLSALLLRDNGKRCALSGTPMTRAAIDLFGILSWLQPDMFTSKWQWANQWCEVSSNGYGSVINGIKPEKEAEFFTAHTPYILRRKKSEVLKDLPPKTFVDVWCEMDKDQYGLYKSMETNAMAKFASGEKVNATSILAEFVRLKQFSDSYCTNLNEPDLTKSSKYQAMLEHLDEEGILSGEGESKVVIFSQFKVMADAMFLDLQKRGVACLKLTGDTKNRKHIVDSFQADDGARVLVMTTTAGGVSITLDRADSAHFLDETWSFADQLQAEDRIHRASRIHNVTIYNYRNKDSIDEYIMGIVDMKESQSEFILDVRRRLMEKNSPVRP